MPAKTTKDPERLLRPAEVCELLGLTRRQLEGYAKRLQPVKVGRNNRFRESVIQDVIENGLR